MSGAILAVPGDLDQRTGGYEYARRILREAEAQDWPLHHLPLPGGFPQPSHAVVDETLSLLARAPAHLPLIVDGLAFGALPADRLPERPITVLLHHPLADETGLTSEEQSSLYELENAALARAARVIATSRTTAERLICAYGVSHAKISVAQPGTDPAPPARGSGGSGVAILSVGSLTKRKGHDVLITALAGLADLNWTCTIVGEARDANIAAALRVQAGALGGRIALAGGMDKLSLDDAYHRADLFVLASRYEGFGMVYTEAMIRGLPVIGTTAGAIPEAVNGGAMLVEPDNVGALQGALAQMIGDADLRAVWAERAAKAATDLPDWSDTLMSVREAIEGKA